MSETLALHCQNYEDMPVSDTGALVDYQVVTGVELSDGTRLRGFHHKNALPEVEVTLAWPDTMAERVTEYYDRHLTVRADTSEGWNCHSFVAAVMEWKVYWSRGAYPYFMPRSIDEESPEDLQDQVPYAISTSDDNLSHSFMGLPDPEQNLGVWGFRGSLRLSTNQDTLAKYPGSINRHRQPYPMLGRLATYMLGCTEKLPARIGNNG